MNNKQFKKMCEVSNNKKLMVYLRKPYERAVGFIKLGSFTAYLSAFQEVGRGFERLNNCCMQDFVNGEYFTVVSLLRDELIGVERKIRNKLCSLCGVKNE